ncbi:NAD(P)/FAD-dependent oxidoreductase [Actinoallomurus sp. CA-150999]|uniref:NAD(P)/FAD-dependent oxidoreductase n=1 Tax=Actinoallomurus sp. CA-150999 TaxID=3239887 RepID=UPI003D89BE84
MTTRIVVLGAGYAGLPAARRLINRLGDDADVTVVSASPSFVERPRLHQTATGQRLRELPLTGLVGGPRGGSLIVGRIGDIDLADRRVRVQARDGERTLGYDVLVYALGSTVDVHAVPGIAAHAHTLSDAGSAERLGGALATAAPGSTVAVCGGGLCGIEMAAELAESRPDLRVLLASRTEPGAWQAPRARRRLRRAFDRLGVEVLADAEVREVAEDALVLDGGRRVPYDLCVWAGGFTVPSLARDAGLAVDDQGRIVVDETLRSVSHPEVYAIGDAAAVPGPWGAALAYGCRTGSFTAPCAADAIADRLAGRTPRSFRFRYFHECVSLGRRDAFIQFLRADQTPSRWVLTGRLAVWYKNIVLDSAKVVFRHPGPYTPHRRPAEPAPVS